MTYYQQGDVIVEPASIPETAVDVPPIGDRLILAEGEATGHAHAVLAAPHAALLADGARRFLCVDAGVDISHEEHDTVSVRPGTYEIRQVREYDHWSEEARVVAD